MIIAERTSQVGELDPAWGRSPGEFGFARGPSPLRSTSGRSTSARSTSAPAAPSTAPLGNARRAAGRAERGTGRLSARCRSTDGSPTSGVRRPRVEVRVQATTTLTRPAEGGRWPCVGPQAGSAAERRLPRGWPSRGARPDHPLSTDRRRSERPSAFSRSPRARGRPRDQGASHGTTRRNAGEGTSGGRDQERPRERSRERPRAFSRDGAGFWRSCCCSSSAHCPSMRASASPSSTSRASMQPASGSSAGPASSRSWADLAEPPPSPATRSTRSGPPSSPQCSTRSSELRG